MEQMANTININNSNAAAASASTDDFASLVLLYSNPDHQITQSTILKEIEMGLEAEEQVWNSEALLQLCHLLSVASASEESLTHLHLPLMELSPSLLRLMERSSTLELPPELKHLLARVIKYYMCDIVLLPLAFADSDDDAAAAFLDAALHFFVTNLTALEYIDTAEQSLWALQKLCLHNPIDCLRAGALEAVLSHIQFFPSMIQKVATDIAAKLCLYLPADASDYVMQCIPKLTSLLQHADFQIVEHAAICLGQIADVLFSSASEKLDELCSSELLEQVAELVSVSYLNGGAGSISNSTFEELIRLLSTSTCSAPERRSLVLFTISSTFRDVMELEGNKSTSTKAFSPSPGAKSSEQLYKIVNLVNELLPSVMNEEGLPREEMTAWNSFDQIRALDQFLHDPPDFLLQLASDLYLILVKVYESCGNSSIQMKCLEAIQKLLYLISTTNMMYTKLKSSDISSFLAGVLTSKDHLTLVTAMSICELLMQKFPKPFKQAFVKEGVIHAIDLLITADQQPAHQRHKRKQGKALKYSQPPNYEEAFGFISETASIAGHFMWTYFSASDTKPTCTLKYLCDQMNVGRVLKAKSKARGKAKALATASHEAYMLRLVKTMLAEISGVSTFEFVNSGIVDSLINYLSYNSLPEESVGSCISKVNGQQGKSRVHQFLELCLPSSRNSRQESPLNLLVRKLQNALSTREQFPNLRNDLIEEYVEERLKLDSRIRDLNIPLEINFERSSNEPFLQNYSSRPVLVKPLTTFATLEKFLWPKVQEDNLMVYKGDKSQIERAKKNLDDTLAEYVNVGDGNDAKDYNYSTIVQNVATADNIDAKNDDNTLKVEETHSIENDYFCNEVRNTVILEESEEEGVENFVHEIIPKNGCMPTSSNGSETRGATSSSEMRLAFASAERSAQVDRCRTNDFEGPPRLAFFLDGRLVDRSLTLFQALERQRAAYIDSGYHLDYGNFLWDNVHTITYQRADYSLALQATAVLDKSATIQAGSLHHTKLQHAKLCDPETDNSLREEFLHDVDKSNPAYQVLLLLHFIERLNKTTTQFHVKLYVDAFAMGNFGNVPDIKTQGPLVQQEEFLNDRLNSKLLLQIPTDPLTLYGCGLPAWCDNLIRACPFLFPFETRRQYFYYTAFDLPRILHRFLKQEVDGINFPFNDHQNKAGKLLKKKFRVSREHILDCAERIKNDFDCTKFVLQVEYFGDVGAGLGPTLEFYTLLSHEFQKKSTRMWRCNSFHGSQSEENDITTEHVNSPQGLFPRPWAPCIDASMRDRFDRVLEHFGLLGFVVAKAIQDNRLLDIPLSAPYYKLILGQELDLYDIMSIDPELGSSLYEMQLLVYRKRVLESNSKSKSFADEVRFRGSKIEDLCLDFTLPGYPEFVLKPCGNNIMVNLNNLEEYVSLVVDATVKSGISSQMEAFSGGFNQVFRQSSLHIFNHDELDNLLCGKFELWSPMTLKDNIKFEHGYTEASEPINYLLEILCEFTPDMQRSFLRFVTGAPRLPLGGLAALNPRITVVRKLPTRDGTTSASSFADLILPSVMTCVNYLKLPPYSCKEVMRQRLFLAITEGQASFDLS